MTPATTRSRLSFRAVGLPGVAVYLFAFGSVQGEDVIASASRMKESVQRAATLSFSMARPPRAADDLRSSIEVLREFAEELKAYSTSHESGRQRRDAPEAFRAFEKRLPALRERVHRSLRQTATALERRETDLEQEAVRIRQTLSRRPRESTAIGDGFSTTTLRERARTFAALVLDDLRARSAERLRRSLQANERKQRLLAHLSGDLAGARRRLESFFHRMEEALPVAIRVVEQDPERLSNRSLEAVVRPLGRDAGDLPRILERIQHNLLQIMNQHVEALELAAAGKTGVSEASDGYVGERSGRREDFVSDRALIESVRNAAEE